MTGFMDVFLDEIKKAISEVPSWEGGDRGTGGVRTWGASSCGWRLLVITQEDAVDGTAIRNGMIVHLPPELSQLAAQKIPAEP